jgi:hypothetical protein
MDGEVSDLSSKTLKMVLTAPHPELAIIFAKLLIATKEVFQKHVFWAYFRRKN